MFKNQFASFEEAEQMHNNKIDFYAFAYWNKIGDIWKLGKNSISLESIGAPLLQQLPKDYLIKVEEEFTSAKIYSVKEKNVKQAYSEFIHKEATDRNLIINPHWYNLMSPETNGMTHNIWKKEEKNWNKFLNKNTIEQFAIIHLNAKLLDYESL